ATDFGLPNGIALSPDEKTLYVGDTVRVVLYAFDVSSDGSLSGQQRLAELKSTEKGAVDGMKVDEKGNIWTTGPGGIWVFSRTGAHLGTVLTPTMAANCAWGDSDYRTLYVTTESTIYKVRTLVQGKITYPLKHGSTQ